MQEILEFILKNITTVPEDIKIEVEEVEGTSNYIITVNPADIGRIIGKEGKVIKAIRTIMRVIAIQRGVHIRISVVSENEPQNTQTPNDQEGQADSTTVESSNEPIPQDDGSITVEV